MSAEFGCKVTCPPLGLSKKLMWFGEQTEAQSYNQLQRCLWHWTLLGLKLPVQVVGFVVPLFLALSKLLARNYEKQRWVKDRKSMEFFYLIDVWISLMWSKEDIFLSESRNFSWLLKVEVCMHVCNMLLVGSYRLVCSGRGLKLVRKCLWIQKFENIGFAFDWLRKWCQCRQRITQC